MTTDLDRWLQAKIRPTLMAAGFRGGPRRFCRSTSDSLAVIQFQGGVANRSGHSKFVVNLGMWNVALGAALGATIKGCPAAMDCHISVRVGELGEDRAERWWEVDFPATGHAEVQVIRAMEIEGFPFLDRIGTLDGRLEFLDQQGRPLASYYREALDRAR